MICEQHFRTTRKDCFCSNPKAIQNYGFAISDEKKMWECHHRLETHFADGTERPKKAQLSKEELIALDMYYNRPPEELIFLTVSEHQKLHNKGKQLSEETKRKMSEALKGHKPWNTGKKLGKWYTNGFIDVMSDYQPYGFTEGRSQGSLKGRKLTDEHKKKISEWNQAHKKERGKAISAGKVKYTYTCIETGETHTMPEWRDLGVGRKTLSNTKKYIRKSVH